MDIFEELLSGFCLAGTVGYIYTNYGEKAVFVMIAFILGVLLVEIRKNGRIKK